MITSLCGELTPMLWKTKFRSAEKKFYRSQKQVSCLQTAIRLSISSQWAVCKQPMSCLQAAHLVSTTKIANYPKIGNSFEGI